MPELAVLRLHASDGQVLVTWGRTLVYRYEAEDLGMRNLAIVALTDAGRRVDEVAAVFGLTATYVSIMRGKARRHGSAALVARRGRPPKLSDRQVTRARVWAGQGWTQEAISQRLGVTRSVISVLLARWGPVPAQEALPVADGSESATSESATSESGPGSTEADDPQHVVVDPVAQCAGSARVGTVSYRCRYAGAMMLFPYLDLVGAQGIFGTLTGGPARRYGDQHVLTTATLGFALGAGTVEATKHLPRAEVGAAVGLAATPQLGTLRGRLSALADNTDPLALQRAFAAGSAASIPAADAVYFVDDHFVPYAGAQPVAKGWNTKRRHAQPGRDDTLVVDARGRAGRGGVWCSTPWRPVGRRRRPRNGRRRSTPCRRRPRRRASPRRTPFVGPAGHSARPGPSTGTAACPAPGWPPSRPRRRPRPGVGAWSPPRCRHPTRNPTSRSSARVGRRTGGPGHQ